MAIFISGRGKGYDGSYANTQPHINRESGCCPKRSCSGKSWSPRSFPHGRHMQLSRSALALNSVPTSLDIWTMLIAKVRALCQKTSPCSIFTMIGVCDVQCVVVKAIRRFKRYRCQHSTFWNAVCCMLIRFLKTRGLYRYGQARPVFSKKISIRCRISKCGGRTYGFITGGVEVVCLFCPSLPSSALDVGVKAIYRLSITL